MGRNITWSHLLLGIGLDLLLGLGVYMAQPGHTWLCGGMNRNSTWSHVLLTGQGLLCPVMKFSMGLQGARNGELQLTLNCTELPVGWISLLIQQPW